MSRFEEDKFPGYKETLSSLRAQAAQLNTGTSDQDAACPFDLESPRTVWSGKVRARIKEGHPCYSKPGRWFAVFMSRADVWEWRSRISDCIEEVYGDPKEITLEEAISRARTLGLEAVCVKNGFGQIVEEYPL